MEEHIYYHIYNCANGDENLYRNDENYNYFLKLLAKYIIPIADVYAYCLMPNHFHLLIRIRQEDVLRSYFTGELSKDLTGLENLSGLISKQFSNLFNAYAKAYNKKFERRGSLFKRPFKYKKISSKMYLTNVINYIHHNPIHHGFTDDIYDWEHSSYHALVSHKATKLNRNYVLDLYGSSDVLKHTSNANNDKWFELENLYVGD